MKKLLFLLLALPMLGHSQAVPRLGIQEVYRDSLVLTWTVPPGGTTTTIERSTNRNFTGTPVTVYSGANTTQLVVDRGLTDPTSSQYGWKEDSAGVSSTYGLVSVRTF